MIPRRQLGATGLEVSVLGYGGAPIGFSDPSREAGFLPLLRQALDLGINFFDTAPDYRRSEELLGQALLGRRHEVVIATKCGRIQTWNGTGWDVHEEWSERGVLETIEGSLRRLQTDYVDLVQLHSPPMWVLEDGAALRGLLGARDDGKVRHIGVSADGDEAHRAVEMGLFETLQISYSILQQEPGDSIIPAAAGRGMGIIAKQPVANGITELGERPSHPDWSWKWDISQQMDWPSLGAPGNRMDLALRWVLANPQVSTAIAGTTHPQHLEHNAAIASDPLLDTSAFERIKDAYREARK